MTNLYALDSSFVICHLSYAIDFRITQLTFTGYECQRGKHARREAHGTTAICIVPFAICNSLSSLGWRFSQLQPLGMKVTFAINPLEGVSAEIITLRLKQIGGQSLATIAVVVRQGS